MDGKNIKALFTENDQSQIFADFDALSANEKQTLLSDCASVDFSWLAERIQQFKQEENAAVKTIEIEPAPIVALPKTRSELAREKDARTVGEEALRAGRLAAFLVAGGQGTRLGFDGPKGCYEVGPVTDKTLFRWHAEQILARAKRYGATIPWYIMTSRANDADTRKYFAKNDYLGFDKEDVMFFQQAVVPSVDFNGKLIRADRGGLALNPDGHGGSLGALVRSGAIADMKKRGVDTISYFQVDNPLVTICDPVFIGYHLKQHAQMSSKILDKSCPEEKVGHICLQNGKTTVIEYSDLDEENMHARESSGRLKFWAGSIAIHMLSVDFVQSVGGGARLPWHLAKKKIPYYDNGNIVTPDQPNGIKFETFVFDALPLTEASVTMEVAREDEFAPVKNATGVDSAESCRQLLSNYFGRWLEAAGVSVPRNENGDVTIPIEISPLFALDENELKAKLPEGFAVGEKIVL
jgi:UDP-N-acetylglucosamine/UDP-N-acetylgalactosamine diphosphorylase